MVGAPHVTKQASDPTRPFAITLTHSEESHAPANLKLGTKPTIEPAEGIVTETTQKHGCTRPKSGYSSDRKKLNALGVDAAHSMIATGKEMMVTNEEDADLPLKGLVNVQSLATYMDHTDEPMAMIYDKDLGWVDEPIGPKTRYWKCINRKNEKGNTGPLQAVVSLNEKRIGPSPLQELNPNSISLKRSKRK